MIDLNQLVPYLIIVVLVVALLYSSYLHARTNRTNPQGQIDLLGAVTDAFKDFMNSPVIVNLGKAAQENIPPEVVKMIIDKVAAGVVVTGADTETGQLLQALEDYLKTIDSDPTNDPKFTAGLREIIARASPVQQLKLPNG